jgi:trans-AT polyketide synthase/acyltransferase/oxidoreductase domain-containing protein
MREPMAAFAEFLREFTFAPPRVPVIANLTGRPYDVHGLRQTLADQIANSVRWLDSIQFLLEHGVTSFEEVGPGNVLTKLAGQIRGTVPRARS